jgi:hypothetical protein
MPVPGEYRRMVPDRSTGSSEAGAKSFIIHRHVFVQGRARGKTRSEQSQERGIWTQVGRFWTQRHDSRSRPTG